MIRRIMHAHLDFGITSKKLAYEMAVECDTAHNGRSMRLILYCEDIQVSRVGWAGSLVYFCLILDIIYHKR